MIKIIVAIFFCASGLCAGGLENKLIQRHVNGGYVNTNIFINVGILTIKTSSGDGSLKEMRFFSRKQEIAEVLEEALKKKYGIIPIAYNVSFNNKKPIITLYGDQLQKEIVAVFTLSDDNSRFERSELK